MKKFLIGSLIAVVLLAVGCTSFDGKGQVKETKAAALSNTDVNANTNIIFKLNNQDIKVALNDSSAAKELLQVLPSELKFEHFNSNEKISYLPTKLKNIEKKGHAPKVGDLCYYIPWGNLCVFMRDYKYSDDLIVLGKVTEGMDLITRQSGDFTITLDSKKNKSKTLVAYFTWAENTKVANEDKIDKDATTSASVLLPGNVGLMAQWIAENTGADKFSILTSEKYSSDYNTCLDRADKEKEGRILPALKHKVNNLQDYDTIYIGYPNWWYSCPMAVLSFLRENDLSKKTVILFCAHGTGGLADSVETIRSALPKNVKLVENVFHVSRPDVVKSKVALQDWITKVQPK